VWRRKEIESYTLEAGPIARFTKASPDDIAHILATAADACRVKVSSRMLAERLSVEVDEKHHRVTVMEAHDAEFERLWNDVASRHYWCDAKDIIGPLNDWLQKEGRRTVSPRSLAARMKQSEIPEEMASVIERANALVDP
jgi:hypothetical protein